MKLFSSKGKLNLKRILKRRPIPANTIITNNKLQNKKASL